MGLERIACVLQGVTSNYETDLFTVLIKQAAWLTNQPTGLSWGPGQGVDERAAASMRIIADHARAATFLISDGVQPSNEGRGYVLRKILRRAIRHGRSVGQEKPFMHEMVFAVRDEMGVAYPELKESAERVAKVVLAEEEQFARVIERGWVEFEAAMRWPAGQAKNSAISVLNNKAHLSIHRTAADMQPCRGSADIPAARFERTAHRVALRAAQYAFAVRFVIADRKSTRLNSSH